MANIEEFLKLDDATVWNKIREIADQCPWANDLTNRTIFARVYESETFKTLEGMKRFIMAKEEIQRKKIRETDYIIDEVQKMPHSWPVINPYDDDKGYGIPILNQNNDPENIAAVSIVIKRMGDDLISIKRIYVRKTHEKLITAIRKKYRL
ncbi:hypothetical protein FACS1894211_05280 [Clostridia bacterium]|nr:hypothetical protein FACS1894211_05280 [Clostridia bacterium]